MQAITELSEYKLNRHIIYDDYQIIYESKMVLGRGGIDCFNC